MNTAMKVCFEYKRLTKRRSFHSSRSNRNVTWHKIGRHKVGEKTGQTRSSRLPETEKVQSLTGTLSLNKNLLVPSVMVHIMEFGFVESLNKNHSKNDGASQKKSSYVFVV